MHVNETEESGIMPPPSMSKAGYMTEIATGTKTLAKLSIRSLHKPPRHSATPSVLPELMLDEFGTGEAYDKGRGKEMLSSPREDVRTAKRMLRDSKASKEKNFNRAMELKYDTHGSLLTEPEPDPVDLKYKKYGVRRPWSSRTSPPPESRKSDGEPLSPEEEEARMLAVLEGPAQQDSQRSSDTRLSAFYLTRVPRDGHIDKAKYAIPCTGQYNPRYNVVHRASPRPLDWSKSANATTRLKRPQTAPLVSPTAGASKPAGGNVPAGTMKNMAGTAKSMGGTMGTVHSTTVTDGEGKPPQTEQQQQQQPQKPVPDIAVSRHHPSNFKQWVARTRESGESNATRPSSAFMSTKRKPLMTSDTPGSYWPYNCFFPNTSSTILMERQQERWKEGSTIGAQGQSPDVVYKATARKASGLKFQKQVSRSNPGYGYVRTASQSFQVFYDTDDRVLSTKSRPRTLDMSKAVSTYSPGAPTSQRPDTRADLRVSYTQVEAKVPGGTDYSTQLSRPEFLHPNENVHLEYDPSFKSVKPRVAEASMDWTDGHGDLFRRNTSQSDCNPVYSLTSPRTNAAHDMDRSTSREHSYGAWKPPQSLDRVYDAAESYYKSQVPHSTGIGFDKQVSRDKREAALKQKLAKSDQFYDLPVPKAKSVIPFDKILPRHKRPKTKWPPG